MAITEPDEERSRSTRHESERALTSPGSQVLKQYPPLVAMVLALLIVVLILPSALNLPQANPSTVLEYAPVPPEDQQAPPSAEGAISSLGLGSSSSLTTGRAEAPSPGRGAAGEKKSERPSVKKCVGNPPRQTEDPNAPPCVAFFEGDNGGATWQGVSRDEIVAIIYHQGFISDQNETEGGDTSAGETAPGTGYCDLDQPSETQTTCQDRNTGQEMSVVAAAKALSRYFNERYQKYGRHVHFYLYWASASSPGARRAEAADNWEKYKPFAVIDRGIFGGHNDKYAEAMAKRRTMVFGTHGFLDNAFFRKNAPQVWSFWPDVEHWADNYVSYVCRKVVGHPVSFAGDDKQSKKMNNLKRKFALMYTSDPSYPGLQRLASLVDDGVTGCGGEIAERVSFPYAGANIDNRCLPDCSFATTNVAKMQRAGVTTVLWAGGMESRTTEEADRAGWYPEWVVAGDRIIDDLLNGRAQNQRVWAHASVNSQQLREIRFEESPARQAFREAAPNARPVHEYWATTLYRDMFTLFKSIQVAGPNLSPQTVDQGQHAIPRQASTDPRIAACFYDPNDFSCVKDAHEAWWDPNAPDPNGESFRGCWRMVDEGKRYLATDWPSEPRVFKNRADTCNGIKGSSHNYPL